MNVLILGGDGMLGHTLLEELRTRPIGGGETRATLRRNRGIYAGLNLFARDSSYFDVDALRFDRLLEVFADFRPDAVVNCIGIVKQRPESKDTIQSLEINSLLPHKLALLCRTSRARLIHISTDCVFDGAKGSYTEDDAPNALDLYGRSKQLGEVTVKGAITLRTSIIGLELMRKSGLIEWLLAQKGTIRGFRKAVFSGLTTNEFARVIRLVLVQAHDLYGLFHVSSVPINKHDLLTLVTKRFRLEVDIQPDDTVEVDRSLSSQRFQGAFGYIPPSWDEMIEELAANWRDRVGYAGTKS